MVVILCYQLKHSLPNDPRKRNILDADKKMHTVITINMQYVTW